MQHVEDFDPEFYFGLVADNLIRNFGPRALTYADQALKKMRTLGDNEGFDMWLSIHEHLSQKAADGMSADCLLFADNAEKAHTVH